MGLFIHSENLEEFTALSSRVSIGIYSSLFVIVGYILYYNVTI